MTCEQCTDKLTDLIGGDLPPETERKVRGHLADCPDCARELAQMEALVAALHGLPEVDPPADLRERLRQIPHVARTSGPSWWRRSRTIAVTITAAAAGLLLVWTGVLFYQQETGSVDRAMLAERAGPPEDAVSMDQRSADSGPAGTDSAATGGDNVLEERSTEDQPPAREPSPSPEESAASPRARSESEAMEVAPAPRRPARSAEPAVPPVDESAPSAMSSQPPSMPEPTRESPAEQAPADVSGDSDTLRDRVPRSVAAEPPASRSEARRPSRVAESDGASAESGTLAIEPPAYLDAGEGGSARIGEGTSFTVGVTPPHEKVTGTVLPATIRIETEADVGRARISVSGSDHLDLVNVGEDGIVFEGPLSAGQQTVLSVRMIARRPGPQSITLRVRSTDPVVDTRLDVGMGDFAEPVPPAERPVQFNFVGTPIREAVAEISRQSGMSVIVDPGVGETTVTARADDAVPAAAALRAVAEAAGLRVTDGDGASIVEGDADQQ